MQDILKMASQVLTKPGTNKTERAGYNSDFFLWTQQQAAALRHVGKHAEIDIINLATEIEDLGKRDRRSLESHCATVIEHLYKLAASPSQKPASGWIHTIQRHQDEIASILEDSPSLLKIIEERWDKVVIRGARAAQTSLALEDGIHSLAPYTIPCRELLGENFSIQNWVEHYRLVQKAHLSTLKKKES